MEDLESCPFANMMLICLLCLIIISYVYFFLKIGTAIKQNSCMPKCKSDKHDLFQNWLSSLELCLVFYCEYHEDIMFLSKIVDYFWKTSKHTVIQQFKSPFVYMINEFNLWWSIVMQLLVNTCANNYEVITWCPVLILL